MKSNDKTSQNYFKWLKHQWALWCVENRKSRMGFEAEKISYVANFPLQYILHFYWKKDLDIFENMRQTGSTLLWKKNSSLTVCSNDATEEPICPSSIMSRNSTRPLLTGVCSVHLGCLNLAKVARALKRMNHSIFGIFWKIMDLWWWWCIFSICSFDTSTIQVHYFGLRLRLLANINIWQRQTRTNVSYA